MRGTKKKRKGKGVRCVGGERERKKREISGPSCREQMPLTVPLPWNTHPPTHLRPLTPTPVPPLLVRARKSHSPDWALELGGAQLWRAGRGGGPWLPAQSNLVIEKRYSISSYVPCCILVAWGGRAGSPDSWLLGLEEGGPWGPGTLVPREGLEPAEGASGKG